MKLLSWVLAFSLMVLLLAEAVVFHKATVCRQKAWLKATEIQTRTLLTKVESTDLAVEAGCKVYVTRKDQRISWQRWPALKSHQFNLPLRGKL